MKYRSNRRFLATISTFVTIQYTAQRSALFFFYHNRFSGNTRSISTSCITVPSLTLKQVFSRNKKFNQASNNHSFSASISVLSFVPPPTPIMAKHGSVRYEPSSFCSCGCTTWREIIWGRWGRQSSRSVESISNNLPCYLKRLFPWKSRGNGILAHPSLTLFHSQ